MGLKDQVIQCCLNNLNDESISSWFNNKLGTIDTASAFYMAFGMVNKKISRVPVQIDSVQLETLQSVDSGFNPDLWTLDQFCRLALMLNLSATSNKDQIETLLASADMREQVTIYKSLQFLENAEDFVLKAVDGIRTNMIDVYDSIALNNAYPSKYFSDSAWNQMVLKAIFMERPIYKIFGLVERNNEKLAHILHDYAHERWAAGRRVSPELWRMMAGFLNNEILEDLKKVIETDTPEAKASAIKAIEESNYPKATAWLEEHGHGPSSLTWEQIGHEVWLSASN